MTAPLAPIHLSPVAHTDGNPTIAPIHRQTIFRLVLVGAGGVPPPRGGSVITFSGDAQDSDSGDWLTGVNVQVFANAATDAVPGSPLINVSQLASSLASADRLTDPWTLEISPAPLTVGTAYRWRARTRDKGGVWGAWSSLTKSRFIPNTIPGAPTNLAVTVTSIDPTFFGSLDDPDPGATIAQVRIQVYEDTSLGVILKWDSDFVDSGGTRFAIDYGGSPLEIGNRYRWRARVIDNVGSAGTWSPYSSWRPADVSGPSAMSPIDVETRQTTLTPTLTIGHSSAFDAYELELGRFADGSGLLWDVPVTTHASTSSKNVVYAGTPLAWGGTYYWRAKVRVAGTTWTDWSAWYPFYIDAVPRAPVITVDDSVEGGVSTVGPYVTVTSEEPTIRIPFNDPDVAKGYADEASRLEVVIEDAFTHAAVSGSPFVDASSPAEAFPVPAATLSFENLYRVRARHDDDAPQRSPFSEFVYFKVSEPPVLSAPTTVDDTDPAPEVGWTFTSPGAKAQSQLRVRVFDDSTGDVVHDSGLVASDVPAYVIPGEVLQDGETYHWDVTAYDTDFLSDFLGGGPWTTAFDTPDALTGLTAVPDTSDSSITLEWDVTTLDADHFWRYYVYRLDPATGEYVRIGAVDDRATPTFVDSDAPHGLVAYRVTVTNGFAESAPAAASTTLALRWWITDPNDEDLRFEVRYVVGFRSRRQHQQDAFEPLGREVPVVVSGSLLAPAGTLAVQLMYDDAEIYGQLVAAAKASPYVVLKDPFGNIFKVKLGSIDDDRGVAGSQNLSVEYRVVAL